MPQRIRTVKLKCYLLSALSVSLFQCFPVAVCAAASGAISQSYQTTTTNYAQGTLLSLVSSGSNIVEPANSSTNIANLIGIAATKPLVELSNDTQHGVQVVVGGSTEALVSDANGSVTVGDKITASPISGIGMKATGPTEIVGTAQASLSSATTVTKSFAGNNGKQVTIKVGLLPIAVGVEYYSSVSSGGSIAQFVPPFLQSLANTLAGKQVSPLRVLLSSITLLFGFCVAVIMLYVAIRSGIISIGRNPLAEASLRRGLVDVLLAAVGVLVVTVILVYLILFS